MLYESFGTVARDTNSLTNSAMLSLYAYTSLNLNSHLATYLMYLKSEKIITICCEYYCIENIIPELDQIRRLYFMRIAHSHYVIFHGILHMEYNNI